MYRVDGQGLNNEKDGESNAKEKGHEIKVGLV